LSEEAIRGDHKPGAGGWPTIKYFNKDTGYEGAPYTKLTDKAMCDELGDIKYMQQYVETAGKTSRCSVTTGKGCSEKETKYMDKMRGNTPEKIQASLDRLKKMASGSMKSDLKQWLNQRSAILKQMSARGGSKEEL